ncbi:aldo/keto reductase [Paraburkholderia phytofirmans]|uniref:aldo/keto reductase n=1 Tax=Paraburkholderia phytofirmans TaxID=261302 RepID=UPI0038BDF4EE
MQYRQLGRSGLVLSRLVLGSTMFGELMDEEQARAVMHRAWDLGVHTVDTGDIYAGGRAEEMIGRIAGARREQLVFCTKVGFRVGDGPADHAIAQACRLDHAERWTRGIAPQEQGLSRHHIIAAVEGSLRRLRTDYIDLYQIHRWDTSVPVDETLRALDDLVRSGKVRYIGCSNARSWQLYEALWCSDKCGLARFESMQVPCSLLDRSAEIDVLPACEHAEVGVIAYSVLAGGLLSGVHRAGIVPGTVLAQRPGYQSRFLTGSYREQLERFDVAAERIARPMAVAALAAVLQQRAVTAATVGVQKPEELEMLVQAVDDPLDDQSLNQIAEIFNR